MKRPTEITVAATLFLLLGMWAGFQVVAGLLAGQLNLNFNILMIPVGIGLLLGFSWSRGGAKFWIVLYAIACVAILLLYPFLAGSSKVEIFNEIKRQTNYKEKTLFVGL